MQCEENLPAPRESLRTELELGTLLLGSEPIIDRYYRIAKDLARHYGINLCDEPEAVLIGHTVWADVALSRGTEVADMLDPIGVRQTSGARHTIMASLPLWRAALLAILPCVLLSWCSEPDHIDL